jgi:hypothetical protein
MVFEEENGEKMSGCWRNYKLARSGYSKEGLAVIRLYHEVCVPHGFWPVTKFSEGLDQALELFAEGGLDEEDFNAFRVMFAEAVEQRNVGDHGYNTPKGQQAHSDSVEQLLSAMTTLTTPIPQIRLAKGTW